MNRKLLLFVLGALIIAALVPWENIDWFQPKQGDRQASIDSLEKELEQAKLINMGNNQRLADMNDSLTTLSIIIERTNKNYNKLKSQNEKLKQERSAIINRFTDDDIERYLSNRYGQ